MPSPYWARGGAGRPAESPVDVAGQPRHAGAGADPLADQDKPGAGQSCHLCEPDQERHTAHVPIEHADIPQADGGVLFHVLDRRAPRHVVIDTDDHLILNASADEADLYFKMPYLRGGQPALYQYRWNWRKLRRRTSATVLRQSTGGARWRA